MKRFTSLIFILILVSLIACKKENNNPLFGQWEWFKTSAGQVVYTSESVDSTHYIEFTRAGNYIRYNNSKYLTSTLKYELAQNEDSNIYKFSESDVFGYKIQHDTLSTWNLWGLIRWTNYYKKIN